MSFQGISKEPACRFLTCVMFGEKKNKNLVAKRPIVKPMINLQLFCSLPTLCFLVFISSKLLSFPALIYRVNPTCYLDRNSNGKRSLLSFWHSKIVIYVDANLLCKYSVLHLVDSSKLMMW